MTWKPFLLAVWHLIEPLVPGALGAAVGQAWERGLGWRDRLIQWVVGVTVAAYLVPAVCTHLLHWSLPLVNAAGFVVGTIAFKAVGRWREAAVDAGVDAFALVPAWLGSWFRRPGTTPEPSTNEAKGDDE